MEERRDDGGWWDRLGEPRHTSPVAADQLRRGRLFVGRVCVCRAAKKSQKVTTPAGVNWPLGLLSVLDGEPVCVLACVAARQTCGGVVERAPRMLVVEFNWIGNRLSN